ncbi:inositol-pentakisphosphate 2-kinase [Paraphysoderma sedebokerense]|nr:inositol-pentakisphosphate 2-kinase [Paraphysoderma sedebokerense]
MRVRRGRHKFCYMHTFCDPPSAKRDKMLMPSFKSSSDFSLSDFTSHVSEVNEASALDIPEFLEPSQWIYRGEGNANVVFANSMHPNIIIRIRKASPADSPVDNSTRKALKRQLFSQKRKAPKPVDDVLFTYLFHHHIIKPLLGEKYIRPLHLLKVTPEFLSDLNEKLRTSKNRPSFRNEKWINEDQIYVLLCEDISSMVMSNANLINNPKSLNLESNTPKKLGNGDVWLTVEIKPKWGFLPESPIIPSSHLKKRICRYCLHRQHKCSTLQSTIVSFDSMTSEEVSDLKFCPLDLYSGETEKVHFAIRSLMRLPRNNLRIWVKSQQVKLPLSVDTPKEILKSISIFLGIPDAPSIDVEVVSDSLAIFLTDYVCSENDLFRKLKHHQKSLDRYDVQFVYPIYQSLLGAQGIENSLTISEWKQILQAYLSRIKDKSVSDVEVESTVVLSKAEENVDLNLMRTVSNSHSSPVTVESILSAVDYQSLNDPSKFRNYLDTLMGDSQTEHLQQIVFEFLLSMTLKDCSIMVTFTPTSHLLSSFSPDQSAQSFRLHSLKSRIGEYLYKIALLDLDPKDLRKMEYWYELDKQIVDSWNVNI